ncbi:phosphotransferase [Streptomyces sp. M19]
MSHSPHSSHPQHSRIPALASPAALSTHAGISLLRARLAPRALAARPAPPAAAGAARRASRGCARRRGRRARHLVGRHRSRPAAGAGRGRDRPAAPEVALRDAIRPYVTVAVPESVAAGVGAGPRLHPRRPASRVSAERRAVAAEGEEDLALLLAGLRAFPARQAAALAVPAARPRYLQALREDAARAAERLAADGAFDTARLIQLTTVPQAHPAAAVPIAVVHGDLKGEHLLTTGTGRVGAVLDWTDAVIGDPAEDIAGLALAVGALAAVRAAERAGYASAVCARGLQLSRCDTVIRLADRTYGADDSPLALLRTQLARAWRQTPLDIPGTPRGHHGDLPGTRPPTRPDASRPHPPRRGRVVPTPLSVPPRTVGTSHIRVCWLRYSDASTAPAGTATGGALVRRRHVVRHP